MTIDTTDLIKALEERKRQLSKWTDKYRAEERIDEIDCIIDTDVPYLVKEESEKPVLKDLEEASYKYHRAHTDEVMDYDGYHSGNTKEVYDVTPGESFIAGWMACKEQMMKEAVEGIAVINANAKDDGFGYVRSDYMPDDFLRDLGKCKIILIKEDEK